MSIESLAMYVATTAIFLVSLTVHEYAHAWTAYRYGDDTAARMGRLTLNPLAHISLFGTIILPLIAHFGWAKPVPVNFAVLTRSQTLKVALAGPASNLLLAVGLTVVFHLFPWRIVPILGVFLLLAIWSNIILAVFNLIPIPPLDGSRIVDAKLTSPQAIAAYRDFSRYGMLILIGFLYLGGFRVFILPVVGVLCRLLGLPYQIFM
jgi:Zn-dependent protease